MSNKRRRVFTAEQKAAAAKIAQESPEKPIPQLAQEIGISESSLRRWVQQYTVDKKGDPGGPLTSDERAELRRLRKELKRVTMERDFLKRATAYFAKGTSQ